MRDGQAKRLRLALDGKEVLPGSGRKALLGEGDGGTVGALDCMLLG